MVAAAFAALALAARGAAGEPAPGVAEILADNHAATRATPASGQAKVALSLRRGTQRREAMLALRDQIPGSAGAASPNGRSDR